MIDTEYDYDDQGFHGSSDKVFVVNCTGSDGPWNRQEWTEVEDDIYSLCETTVDECEQEINEGERFVSDEVRTEVVEELYRDVMADVLAGLETLDLRYDTHRRCRVQVKPWYAVNQRCTFTLDVLVSTYEEVYGA